MTTAHIAPWMLATMAFSLFVSLAAYAAERMMHSLRLPRRAPWMFALVLSATWPIVAPWVITPVATVATTEVLTVATNAVVSDTAATGFDWKSLGRQLAPWLVAAWVIVSTVLLVRLARAAFAIQRLCRAATRDTIDGTSVLIHDAIGPAAVGVIAPQVVVPSWLSELESPMRALVLKHETEHCRAGDARLVWLGAIATALFPWNVAMWWSASRLRLAMEIDCDARTIGDADSMRYARLLLLIAQRHGTMRAVLNVSPTLSPTAAQLQRRILAMRHTVSSRRWARAISAAALALVAVAAACSRAVSGGLSSGGASVAVDESLQSVPPGPPIVPGAGDTFVSLLPNHLNEPKYPDAARTARATGVISAQFVVNNTGLVEVPTLKIIKVTSTPSSPELNDAFVQSLKAALPDFRYKAAVVKGQNVKQLVRTEFTYRIR